MPRTPRSATPHTRGIARLHGACARPEWGGFARSIIWSCAEGRRDYPKGRSVQRELDISGPPGAGKTKQIQRLAVASAVQFGPDSLGACTFTRAAATELRLRIGGALHIPLDTPTLRRRIPYVGTIHSISWRLLGRPPLIAHSDLMEFSNGTGAGYGIRGHNNSNGDWVPSPDEIDALSPSEPSAQMSEVELALVLLSQIRHRYPATPDPALHIYKHLPPALPAGLGAERLLHLMRAYQQFKLDKGLSDFEDFLERGRDETLPVKVLIVDEAQDNSPLLWSVIDKWARNVHTLIIASDPYQSIFRFAGADPVLCRDRRGQWLRLDAAHRFSDEDAQYAKQILRSGSWNAPEDNIFHDSWRGTGDSPPDGTTFWLARTHNLLVPIRARLLDSGTPFAELRGKAPLAQKAARAYLTSQKWARGEALSASELHLFVESLPPRVAKLGVPAAIKRLAATPGLMLSPMEVRDKLGLMTPPVLAEKLMHYEYYARVWSAQGEQAFKDPPKISLSTIHGAKGREADVVHLVRSWGILPGREARVQPKGEACVAYVGASRHRKELILEDGFEGIEYNFPKREESGC